MSHSKDYQAGEWSYHYRPLSFGSVYRGRARGTKREKMYLSLGGMMCDNGQLNPDDVINYFLEYKKQVEARKNGFKR